VFTFFSSSIGILNWLFLFNYLVKFQITMHVYVYFESVFFYYILKFLFSNIYISHSLCPNYIYLCSY
jgi:hypothetical protein